MSRISKGEERQHGWSESSPPSYGVFLLSLRLGYAVQGDVGNLNIVDSFNA